MFVNKKGKRKSKLWISLDYVANEKIVKMLDLLKYNNEAYVCTTNPKTNWKFAKEIFRTNQDVAKRTNISEPVVAAIRQQHKEMMQQDNQDIKDIIIRGDLSVPVRQTCLSMLQYSKLAAINYFFYNVALFLID